MNLTITKQQEKSLQKIGLNPDRVKRGFAQSVEDQNVIRREATRIRNSQRKHSSRWRLFEKLKSWTTTN